MFIIKPCCGAMAVYAIRSSFDTEIHISVGEGGKGAELSAGGGWYEPAKIAFCPWCGQPIEIEESSDATDQRSA